ncbi:hypothetical protein EJ02DRAFT_351559, partial [Clathrospora elynae]
SAPEATFATIIVGQGEVHFVVHESLLTQRSKFFRAALTGRFKEDADKIVRLQDEEPSHFEFFVHWLY